EASLDPDLLALLGGVGDLGRVEEGPGGDAATVQAGTAELVLLDQDNAHVEFCCAYCRRIAAAAAAKDDEVEGAAVLTHGNELLVVVAGDIRCLVGAFTTLCRR